MVFAFVPLYVWLPVLLTAVMPFEVALLIFLTSRLSGWTHWVRRYPAGPAGPPAGAVFPGCGVRMLGGLNARFGRLFTTTVCGAGLHVAASRFIAWCYPPLLLPWTCVRGVGEARFQGCDSLKVTCEAEGDVFEFYLPPEAADAVSAQRPGA